MADLNVMLMEHAKAGLQTQLDTAVTNGDTEAARKAADELAKLSAATAPKAPPYGNAEITAELEKQPWFGIDPKKSARVVELGKSMNPKRFNSAVEFAAALVKAVEEEFKPTGKQADAEDGEADDDAEDEEADDDKGGKETPPKKPRASDGPSDNDATGSTRTRRTGPWAKMSDAPSDVQKEINRTADKFAPKTKEGREKFVVKALEAQYVRHQSTRKK